ncbi:MAG: recombination factor protein RarA [candidate division WS6 bacterium GW2011_GWF2_39_15]|uniref:Recombination factor protein RarA n=1 Tax=candidate division WS6 bacterium GW2011_GWF2_39_15 TaxID=1619100 RepID=A0A0G0MQ73_9BACT|nr:MAG: recombination factor protein RarA [candidate division WS6 bacterium GW2011_GWF2_39_15]
MNEPLASKYRPNTLSDFVGQKHLVGDSSPIYKFIKNRTLPSMIFWGPPGTGKTTLAYIISQDLFYDFHRLQAISSGKSTLLKLVKVALNNQMYGKGTIVFIDEIHRWNKAQQDVLLPYVEKGIITLIGATTENPSFRINGALLSRTKVFVFKQHTLEDIKEYLVKISKKEFPDIKISKDILENMSELSNGDLRSGLNILQISADLSKEEGKITKEILESAIQKNLYYDRAGDEHFNLISAVHKSLRSSNADAACYWIIRMLEGGEDPLYIARRMVRFAAEDIGNADPNATILANAVYDVCNKLGVPECDVHLIQLAIYLAKAPKDNTTYRISQEIKADIKKFGNLEVPLHIRNAPTQLMKDLGYGDGYQYDHDLPDKKSDQQCMPDKLKDRRYNIS